MTWLQKRLKELGYTHEDLRQLLRARGIKKSRVSITNWANGSPIPLLNNVRETKIFADVLQWSLPEMLVAMGHDLEMPVELLPEIEELLPLIRQYHELSPLRRQLFMETLQQFAKLGLNISDDDLTDALGNA